MAKKRVHELAKEFGLDNKTMIEKLHEWGYDTVKSHSSTLEEDQVRAVSDRIANERKAEGPAAPRPGGVVIRRSKAMGQTLGTGPVPAAPSEPAPELEPVVAEAPEAAEPEAPAAEPVAAEAPQAAEPVAAEAPVAAAPVAAEPVAAQASTAAEPAAATPAAPVAAEPPAAPIQRPTANQAVVVRRAAPGFTPPGVQRRPSQGAQQPAAATARPTPSTPTTTVLPASAMRPGVAGTAANTRSAPITPTAAAEEGAQPVAAGTRPEDIGADEEIRIIAGVPHRVKKATEVGRPTATQAVLVSRPVYIEKRVTPTQARPQYPMAPGIRADSLVRPGIRDVQVINEGGRVRELVDSRKKRTPGIRNDKVQSYSKQDLIDLVRARAYVPVIGRKKRPTKKGKRTEITEMKESKKVISIEETISLRELSEKMGIKGNDLIRKLLAQSGGGPNRLPAPPPRMTPSGHMRHAPARPIYTLNSTVDYDTAAIIASDYGWEVKKVSFEVSDFVPQVVDKPEDLKARPPVVTVMGHVDHGKTSLLDALRQARVAAGEAGGITQHIGAYSVTLPGKGDITFLDTPGHEAFSAMRERGASITDLIILVVAADDGVQPQTIESIKHAKEAEVPVVVAINKIDKHGVNPDLIKGALANHGLQPEDWGGNTPMIPVSAKEGTNLDLLLENVLLQAEIMELGANPNKPANGVVIESKLERGRGPVATVFVSEGTLKSGDTIVVGTHYGRVRTMTDEKGRTLKQVLPGYPVQVVGLSGAPDAGDEFHVVPDEATAKKIADHRVAKQREAELARSVRMTVEDVVRKTAAGAAKELVAIVKADVQGTVEAVSESMKKLSGKKVTVNIISRGVGNITESDVNQAHASKAIIVGFNSKPDANAASLASQHEVKVKSYSIIYELLDDVRSQMEDLLEPIYREKPMGKAEVRAVFNVSKVGTIAGSMVTEGKVTRASQVRVTRDRKVLHTGKISSLKRFKDDVREVVAGTECGIGIEGFDALQAGDLLELFEIETIRQSLD